MAAIDKTYISDWETFDEIRNWALKQRVPLKDGTSVSLRDYMYCPDLTKEEWDKNAEHSKSYSVVLWNTPIFVDVWLIKNCPFEYIQDTLKEQYGGGWSKLAFTANNDDDMYAQIKEGRSIYDTYQRNGLGKKSKIVFHHISGSWCRDKKCWWWIDVNPGWVGNKKLDWYSMPKFWYNRHKNMWYCDEELMPTTESTCTEYNGCLTKKNIVNIIKRWNLPKGTIVKFDNLMGIRGRRYLMHSFWCEVK